MAAALLLSAAPRSHPDRKYIMEEKKGKKKKSRRCKFTLSTAEGEQGIDDFH